MDGLKGILWTQIKALKPSFLAKKPHFNFISAHCELRVDPLITLYSTSAHLLTHAR